MGWFGLTIRRPSLRGYPPANGGNTSIVLPASASRSRRGPRSGPDLDSFGADHDFSAVPVSVGVVTTLSGSAPPDVWW
jgi:hypothetical protein